VAYVRTVKTASDATAVQIVHSSRAGSREIEHIGSAHSQEAVEALKAAARQRLHVNQDALDLGDGRPAGEPLSITRTRAAHLWEALSGVCDRLGLDVVTGQDEVFKALVLARVIEPVSKLDTILVLAEIGVDPPGYRTIFRRLKRYASDEFSDRLTVAFTKHASSPRWWPGRPSGAAGRTARRGELRRGVRRRRSAGPAGRALSNLPSVRSHCRSATSSSPRPLVVSKIPQRAPVPHSNPRSRNEQQAPKSHPVPCPMLVNQLATNPRSAPWNALLDHSGKVPDNGTRHVVKCPKVAVNRARSHTRHYVSSMISIIAVDVVTDSEERHAPIESANVCHV